MESISVPPGVHVVLHTFGGEQSLRVEIVDQVTRLLILIQIGSVLQKLHCFCFVIGMVKIENVGSKRIQLP